MNREETALQLVLRVVERCLLSLVLAFLAAVLIGITGQAHTSEAHPRTVNFTVNHDGVSDH